MGKVLTKQPLRDNYSQFQLTVVSLLMLILISMTTNELLAAKFYKFKDKNGKIVVSSTLPPEVSQNGYEIVNEHYVVIETIAPRKTEAQLREEKINKVRLEKEAKMAREQEQLDSILINSYTDISDIERARDNELVARERDIMLLKQNIRRLTRLLEDTQTRAARDERLGRALSKKLVAEVAKFKRRIASESAEVIKIEENKDIITERFSSSIIRFSELKAAEQLRRHNPETLASADSKAVIFQCFGEERCNLAWQTALRYANDNSTTELAWANETTIMMRKPRDAKDISIMLTRVVSRNKRDSSIVMEVRCNKSQKGEDLCASEKVRVIEKDFIPYLN